MDISQIRKIPLFAGLTTDHLHLVQSIGEHRPFRTGEVIFPEGAPGSELFVIVDGQVRISKSVPGVGEEALAILGPGSHFGEMALVDDTPRSADAIAHSHCTLWAIEKQDLQDLMFLHKDLAYELLWTFVRTLAGRLRETSDKIRVFFALSSHF